MVDKTTEMLIINGERVSTEDMKRFWKDRPDPDFDAKHNEEVVARSIKHAEEHRAAMLKAQNEGLGDRVNALSSFIKYKVNGGSKDADGYFGRREMARLQGKKVMTILQERKANGQPLWRTISTE